MKNSPIDSKTAGQRNEKMILSILRSHGKLSQTELCRLAGIGSSTASTIVARLREKGLVTETRGSSQRRGPKPTIIEINSDSYYGIGIEINPSYLYIGLFNFIGIMKDKIRIPLGTDHSQKHVENLIVNNIPMLLSNNGIENEKVLGAGVTLSGSVSSDGKVSLSSPMGWKNVPLQEILSEYFIFPVRVYSNRIRLLAEFAINPVIEKKNILYLNVANGVGSTVYMNGQLIYGATGRYGETGHIVVNPDGPLCGCGNKGCLEALISGPALESKIKQDIQAGAQTAFKEILNQKTNGPAPEILLSNWAELATLGDQYAISLKKYAMDHFSRAAAMLINCYDPDVVILAGYVALQFPVEFADAIRDKMRTDVYENPLRTIEIIPAKAGEDALIKGVSTAILQDSVKTAW